MAAMLLFRTRLVSRPSKFCRSLSEATQPVVPCERVDNQALPPPTLNKPISIVDSLCYTLPETIYMSLPLAYLVKNYDVPHSMFMRLTPTPHPPSQGACNNFMKDILLDPPIAQPAVARHCLAQMILRGSLPILKNFFVLVKPYCRDLHLTYHHVDDLVFKQMKAVGVEPDDSFYQTLIDAVCARFGPVVGFQLMKKLRSSDSIEAPQLPLSCYNVVVRHFCKRKMIENEAMVLKLIDSLIYMKEQRVFPDEKIIKCLLKGLGYGGDGFSKAVSVGSQMFAQGIKIKAVSIIIVKINAK